jgi:DNA-binding HxlR family transcriptional regulator
MEQMLITLLADKMSRLILEEIADKKKVSFKEIRNSVPPPESAGLVDRLEKLREASLVGVVKSQYSDFNTYYLTADGLRLYRTLTNTLSAAR